MCDLVRRATKAVDGLVRAHGHELILSCPKDLSVMVDADPVRIEQVLNNLLTNSIKYTPSGGTIRVTVTPAESQVEIRVRDTGVGMTPELLPKVFDLFTQADRSLDRSQGGMGIGLTLVRSLLEMHGGTIMLAATAQATGASSASRFRGSWPRHPPRRRIGPLRSATPPLAGACC